MHARRRYLEPWGPGIVANVETVELKPAKAGQLLCALAAPEMLLSYQTMHAVSAGLALLPRRVPTCRLNRAAVWLDHLERRTALDAPWRG